MSNEGSVEQWEKPTPPPPNAAHLVITETAQLLLPWTSEPSAECAAMLSTSAWWSSASRPLYA